MSDRLICSKEIITADINLLGGIEDIHLIRDIVIGEEKQLAVSRTQKSYVRNKKAIEKNVLTFNSELHQKLFEDTLRSREWDVAFEKFLFWQMCYNNLLFDDVTKEVYLKYYFNGRASIESREIEAYLKDKYFENEIYQTWSSSTKKIIGSKYLSFLKKLGFIEGKVKKRIIPVTCSERELCVFIHFLSAIGMLGQNLINAGFERYCFMSQASFTEMLKRLALKEIINFEYTGDKLMVSPKNNNERLVDVIYNGT